jgi:hypothetical protein
MRIARRLKARGAQTAQANPSEMQRLFPGSAFRKNQWLRGLATLDSCY